MTISILPCNVHRQVTICWFTGYNVLSMCILTLLCFTYNRTTSSYICIQHKVIRIRSCITEKYRPEQGIEPWASRLKLTYERSTTELSRS